MSKCSPHHNRDPVTVDFHVFSRETRQLCYVKLNSLLLFIYDENIRLVRHFIKCILFTYLQLPQHKFCQMYESEHVTR